jgi:hypothetical protein
MRQSQCCTPIRGQLPAPVDIRRALEASLDCGFTPNGIDFEWNGADEGDQVSGDGWADLRDDGCLEGEIAYHNGDETTFIAAPWKRFSAAC